MCFLGQGRFGKVYTAVNSETGELLAMKEIQLQPFDHKAIRSLALELRIFEGIVHQNLVRYYGVEVHKVAILIFRDFALKKIKINIVEVVIDRSMKKQFNYFALIFVLYSSVPFKNCLFIRCYIGGNVDIYGIMSGRYSRKSG